MPFSFASVWLPAKGLVVLLGNAVSATAAEMSFTAALHTQKKHDHTLATEEELLDIKSTHS
jgi:hypothetical protein